MATARKVAIRSRSYADRATDYARGVVTGKVAACEDVKAACRRHIDWIGDGQWVFDEGRANRVCAIIECFRHIKGQWASRRETIRLEDWQCFVVCSLFGWVDGDGLRVFRQAYIKIPRKNSKSTLAAAIGLVMAFADDEAGAEVYSGATSEKQALEVFTPARLMAQGDFAEAFGLDVRAKSILAPDLSRFLPVIGKPGDGSSPHCAIIDEYHEHATAEQYDTMVTGMGARAQPLALVITTAGANIAGPCYDLEKRAGMILRGLVRDDSFFALMYGIDRDDDWRNYEVWKKANPNYSVSVSERYLRDRYEEALSWPSKQGVNLTKHLNIWVSSKDAWLNRAKWDLCARAGATEEDYNGCSAWIGCDLASNIDLAAIVARVEGPDGKAIRFPRFYVPSSALQPGGKNTSAYADWAAAGHLTVTDGDEIDFEFIERDIRHWLSLFRVEAIGFDPWQSRDMMQRLLKDGAPVVEFQMRAANMTPVMIDVEGQVEGGRYLHPAHPVLDWMAGNVVQRLGAGESRYPIKPPGQDHLKIDGVVAALMADGLAMAAEPPREKFQTLFF